MNNKKKNEGNNCLNCIFCAADGFGKYHCSYYREQLVSADDFKQANDCTQYDTDY